MKLFRVGSSACRPKVLAEISRQMFSHQSDGYKVIHKQTVERCLNIK